MEGATRIFDTTDPARLRASRRVTFVSMFVNVLLSLAQIVIGVIGHSQALVADAFHTLADLTSDIAVLFAVRHSSKEADADHPYGHARIETAVTVLLGVLLVLVALGIGFRAALRMVSDAPYIPPASITLWIAGLTIVAKEGLYRYTSLTARRFGSELLRASAWHHRSDAVSSVIVFAGIGGSLFGFQYGDALAAAGVAVFIARIGVALGWRGVKELIDTSLDQDAVSRIEQAIRSVDGVQALHMLRTRSTGGRALVDVHIIVNDRISVSEGHFIAEAVRRRLLEEVDIVADVMVHIDTEDDMVTASCEHLPSRAEVRKRLDRYLAGTGCEDKVQGLNLHYGDGKLSVELLLPVSCARDAADAGAIADTVRKALRSAGDPDICDVTVQFSTREVRS
jgi:cation diffusion facilitator family transporter